MHDPITSGRRVRDLIAQGWELWHVSRDALPGRWELRGRGTPLTVSWGAIEAIRRHHLDWFRQHTEETQEGRNTWCYRLRQKQMQV